MDNCVVHLPFFRSVETLTWPRAFGVRRVCAARARRLSQRAFGLFSNATTIGAADGASDGRPGRAWTTNVPFGSPSPRKMKSRLSGA